VNILVLCRGFIGDVLFASSLAKKLRQKYPNSRVDYVIPVIQPLYLLQQNPYIDNVYTGIPAHTNNLEYNMYIEIPVVDQRYPATIQMQAAAGIEDQDSEYTVYTLPEHDKEAKQWLREYRAANKSPHQPDYFARPVIAYQRNWYEKSFLFTKEEYDRAVDVPHMGYGGKKRNIDYIIQELSKDCLMVPVGLPDGYSQFDQKAADPKLYSQTASIIKHCDFFLGSEGGLSNLAAGVGTVSIITTDFIWQLYGPKGIIKQIEAPQMGPATYFPDCGHKHLDPFITDERLIGYVQGIAAV
jgi:hypothetical protein